MDSPVRACRAGRGRVHPGRAAGVPGCPDAANGAASPQPRDPAALRAR